MVSEPRLIIKDGTVYNKSECGYAEHNLWCWIQDVSMVDAFAAFSNPDKTETITFEYGSKRVIYKGFTELNIIRKSEFTVDICLTGENTSIEEEEVDANA